MPNNRRLLYYYFVPLALVNWALYFVLRSMDGIVSFVLALIFTVLALICLVIEFLRGRYDAMVCFQAAEDDTGDAVIPKGTQICTEGDNVLRYVTTRAGRHPFYIRWYCHLFRKPYPSVIMVPIKRVDT
jgi:hypothetical protein